jgi:hypothetical protein
MGMPMNDDDCEVEVGRSGQGLSQEEPSHERKLATITTRSGATTTASSSSSPSSNSNVGSFSFRGGSGEDVDEGFEVVGFATTPTMTTCTPVQEEDDHEEDDDDDDDSSSSAHSSSVDLDLQVNKINVSDLELMRDVQNPGALRLTAEGLQSHERRSFQRAMHMHGRRGDNSNVTGNDNDITFEQWRRAKLQQKWHREKHKERQEKLANQNIRIRQSLQQQQQQQQQQKQRKSTTDSKRKQARTDHTDGRTQKGGVPSKNRLVAIKSTFVKDDVEEFSLAPLNMMDNLDLKITANEVAPTKAKKFGIFGLFRSRSKSSDVSATARALLQKERQAAVEAQTQKKLRELQERQRIERNRQAYLEKERIKESDMAPIHIRVFPKPLPGDGDWI